jgi:U3 small nucleolar RNA-associated protein 4
VDEDHDAPSRIFTAGLDGNILELDIENGRCAAASDSYGGAVWQLAVEPPRDTPQQPQSRVENIGDDNAVAKSREQRSVEIQSAVRDAATAVGDDGDESDLEEGNEPLTERDLIASQINSATEISSSACPRLAAACDDGCVRLFSVDSGRPGVTYSRSLPRVEGRTLAVAWHPNGRCVVSGGTDGCIHAWDVNTGHELLRITAGDASGKELCVWALLVLPDGTIVSGDSCGGVAFWEGRFGTQIARFAQHDADVLQLAASADGASVFAAGVDPRIAIFRQTQRADGGVKPEWAFLSAKRPHTHDVRAMCVAHKPGTSGSGGAASMLFTGGNDTLLLSHSVDRFLKEHPRQVNEVPQKPILQAAADGAGTSMHTESNSVQRHGKSIADIPSSGVGLANGTLQPPHTANASRLDTPYLMSSMGNTIDIWRLSSSAPTLEATHDAPTRPVEGSRLLARDQAIHLARLTNRSGDMIVTAALSCDGRFLAYSDAYKLRCFELKQANASDGKVHDLAAITISLVQLPPETPAALHLQFVPGASNTLVAVAVDAIVRVFELHASDHAPGTSVELEGERGARDGKPAQPATGGLRHTIRDVHDVRYKMWFKRDRMKNAARRLMPPVEAGLVSISPDGRWLAAAVRGRVHVVSFQTHRLAAQIPPIAEQSPLTALGFTPDSSTVIAVSAGPRIAAFDVSSGAASEWTQKYAETLPRRLQTLPGRITGISQSPAGSKAVLLHSAEALCHLDLAAPLPGGGQPSGKRQRTRERPGARVTTPEGENCRVLYASDPLLFVQGLGGNEVLVVERSWAEVHRKLPPPLYRHRYGT